jgi:hypothetical protein
MVSEANTPDSSYRLSGVNLQIVAFRPCRSATRGPSKVHPAEIRSLAPSPASRVLRPDFKSASRSGLNQESAANHRRHHHAVCTDHGKATDPERGIGGTAGSVPRTACTSNSWIWVASLRVTMSVPDGRVTTQSPAQIRRGSPPADGTDHTEPPAV